MYAKRIDTARKVVAVSFTVFGLGFAIAVNLGYGAVAIVLWIGTLASLIAAFGLFVEYLVRARFEARKGRAAAYQFTLAEMMVVTAAVAVVLGVFRILGWCTIGLLIVVVLLLACGVEMVRLRRTEDSDPKAPDDAPVPAPGAKAAPSAALEQETKSNGHVTKR